jgi:hypothetical protein
MTIPITFSKDKPDSDAPQGNSIPSVGEFLNVGAIWSAAFVTGSKKDKHLPTFWAF